MKPPISVTHPEIAAQLVDELNDNITSADLTAGSGRQLWWKCKLDHRWRSVVKSRIRGENCPYCAGKRVWPGFNDLATSHPEIAMQLVDELNDGVTGELVTYGSTKKLWWECAKGHRWNNSPNSRSNGGTGCPVCSNTIVLPGFNDLATTRPDLAAELADELNDGVTAKDFMKGSGGKKLWWRCDQGHLWKATPNDRNSGYGCRHCAGRFSQPLSVTHPEIARQFIKAVNGEWSPEIVTAGSSLRGLWECDRGHRWEADIVSRKKGYGCSKCYLAPAIEGTNDLATTHPLIASQLVDALNEGVTSAQVTSGSSRILWWECGDHHRWRTTVSARTRINPTACPACTKYGHDGTAEGDVYFIASRELLAFKVGITNTAAQYDRISTYGGDWVEVFRMRNLPSGVARRIERDFFAVIRAVEAIPYLGREEMGNAGGWTETFSQDVLTERQVIEMLQNSRTQ
jgi:hypothetical protein